MRYQSSLGDPLRGFRRLPIQEESVVMSRHRTPTTNRRCLACLVVLVCVPGLLPARASAAIISFDTNDWDHGSGSQTGWNDGETTGTTTFNGVTLTITSNLVRNAVATSGHMTRLNESYFSGFAFQLDPSTTNNGRRLRDYLRLDFEFSAPVYLTSFTLTDVDRTSGQWYDVIAAEGFINGLDNVGTGISANYAFENPTNLEEVSRYGLDAVRARSNTGNVQNTSPADVTFSFDQGVMAFSIYYWNDSSSDDGASTQTIGIRGNQFEIVRTPEPGSIAMCLLALLMLAVFRNRLVADSTTDRVLTSAAT